MAVGHRKDPARTSSSRRSLHRLGSTRSKPSADSYDRLMSSRVYYRRLPDSRYTLLKEFQTREEAMGLAERLSGVTSWNQINTYDSISGKPALGFEYQRADELWRVEVDL